MNVGEWVVEARDDDDGHLTLSVSHRDGTRVHCCHLDIESNDVEWSDRFTTEGIESTYAAENIDELMWSIQSRQVDDETGDRLFWSNHMGWVSGECADSFTTEERQKCRLPLGASGWVRCPHDG